MTEFTNLTLEKRPDVEEVLKFFKGENRGVLENRKKKNFLKITPFLYLNKDIDEKRKAGRLVGNSTFVKSEAKDGYLKAMLLNPYSENFEKYLELAGLISDENTDFPGFGDLEKNLNKIIVKKINNTLHKREDIELILLENDSKRPKSNLLSFKNILINETSNAPNLVTNDYLTTVLKKDGEITQGNAFTEMSLGKYFRNLY